jgi:hypothetical protein
MEGKRKMCLGRSWNEEESKSRNQGKTADVEEVMKLRYRTCSNKKIGSRLFFQKLKNTNGGSIILK